MNKVEEMMRGMKSRIFDFCNTHQNLVDILLSCGVFVLACKIIATLII